MYLHKTVLVSCHIFDSPQAIPLATAILKTYQPYKEEVEVILKDYYLNDTPSKAADSILKCNPNSVGFSMYIWNRDFLVETAEIIKETNKDITIFAGGAEITASAISLEKNKNFDYLVRGEGELPFVHLLNYLIGKDIIKPDKLLKMLYLKNLELSPSPFLNANLNPEEWEGLLWELSRGCPYNCSFCSESRGVKGVRYYKNDRIQKELILFEEKKVEQIFVLDPTFNIDKKRALSIIGLIKEHAPKIHFTFEIRAELLDEELTAYFAELHCSLQIGLQSSQIDVLKNVNRSLNPKQFSEKIDLLNKYGVVFGLDLIYGLPGDTLNGFFKSLDYALYQIPNHLDIFRLSIFPGTVLFEKAEHFNLNYKKKVPYSIISSPSYNDSELSESGKIADAVDIFYNKGKSAPWLLSIVDVLNIRPAKFFSEFSTFMINHAALKIPYNLQYKFLEYIFEKNNKTEYKSAALDLCKFHFLYSEALYDVSDLNEDQVNESIFSNEKFIKSPILKTGIFSYDVNLYAEQGMINIKNFVESFTSEESYALIFNNGYEIETISIEKYLYNVIEKFTGDYSIIEIMILQNIEYDDIEEFIEFLLEMKLIAPVNTGAH
jgi:radical SAM superfamily enzyme YgiQ (UPF0313 family)